MTLVFMGSLAHANVFKKIGQRHDVYRYALSTWGGTDSFRWTYNSNAAMTELLAIKGDTNNNWNSNYRYTYTLNSNDQVSGQLRENWLAGNWVNNTRYTNTYDATGNLTTVLYEVWNSGTWKYAGKIEYTGYNALNHYATETVYGWNGSAWTYLSKDNYQYYANQYQVMVHEEYDWNASTVSWDSIVRLYYTYNQDSVSSITHSVPHMNNWLQQTKETFTYSTSPFQLQDYLVQDWDTVASANIWVNDQHTAYTYNSAGQLEVSELYHYITTSLPYYWDPLARKTQIYSGGLLAEQYDEIYSGGAWSNNHRSTYNYTGSNVTEELQFNGSGSNWLQSNKLDYVYDANNLNTFREIDTFNGAIFIPNNRDFYYYNSFTVNTINLPFTMSSLQLYPNPCMNQTNISWSSKQSGEVQLNVYDMQGKMRMLILQPVWPGNNLLSFDVSSLPPGKYQVTATDETTHQHSSSSLLIVR